MQADYVYTHTGWQRPVFLSPEKEHRFALTLMPEDRAHVEVSYDPIDVLKTGKGRWEPFEGGVAGGLYEVTAIRVCVDAVSGWVVLRIQ